MLFSYYKKKLNPKTDNFHLVGFGKTRIPSEDGYGISELWLRICRIGSGKDALYFIAFDTLYFSRKFTDTVFDVLLSKHGIERKQIIFNASHTHSAPNIGIHWDELDVEYSVEVEHSIYEGISHCLTNETEGFIGFTEITPDEKLFLSRRKKVFAPDAIFQKKVKRLPNPEAVVDTNIRTIVLYNSDRKPVVIIYNFACHPVFNKNMNISSDFPGVISNELEKKVEVALFLQGFCGDVRANYYNKADSNTFQAIFATNKSFVRSVLQSVKLMLYREMFIFYNAAYFNRFIEKIIQSIGKGMDTIEMASQMEVKINCFVSKLASSTGKVSKEFFTTVIQLNNSLFVSIPAEVNTCFYFLIKKVTGNKIFFPMGYAYEMLGYLPGSHEIKEAGYEVESFGNYEFDSVLSIESLKQYESELVNNINKICC